MATTNKGQSALSNFQQKMYADFSGGYNDTTAAISIEDNQMAMSENADYSAERKSLQTRKGCVKVNEDSYETKVTDGYAWLIGSVHKKCIVKDGIVYDLNTETGVASPKITLSEGAEHIYPFVMYNTLYFGDGTRLYEWGHYDYASELGKKVVKRGEIVKCNDENLGLKGHFYRLDIGSGHYVNSLPDSITIGPDNIPSSVTRTLFNPWYVDDMASEDVLNWDTDRIYVNLGETDGRFLGNHWFYYDNGDWEDGGVFKTSETISSSEIVRITDMAHENIFEWNQHKIYINVGERYGRFKTNHWFYYDAPDWEDGGIFNEEEGIEIDLSTENYTNTNKWGDATDVPEYSSSVVRVLEPYDSSEREIVRITVYSSATSSGTLTLCLNDVTKQTYITSGASVNTILTKLKNMSFTEWTSEITSENTITFTCDEKKACNAGYVDGSTTGIALTYQTIQEGSSSNCDMTEVNKCTIFCVHHGSNRVFAAGNPDDNALYYSEIGRANYFQSKVNKLYPAINGYGKITGMCNLSSALVVSYENGWYTWKGITPLENAYWEPLNIPYGCVAPRSICLTPQSFTYLARDGIYMVSSAILNDQYILLQTKQVIKKLSEDVVEKTIESMTDYDLCTAVFWNNKYMLAYSTNGEYCDKVLQYEWDTGAFTLLTGWKVTNWLNDHDNLFFTSFNYVLKAFIGLSDIDTETGEKQAIVLHVKTKEYFLDDPQVNKVCQMISFIFQQYGKLESSIKIIIHAGYQKYDLGSQDLAESLYYGRIWGKAWGHREVMIKVAELVIVSNTFQIEMIADNVDDPITLYGIGFSYADTDLVIPSILKDEELMR